MTHELVIMSTCFLATNNSDIEGCEIKDGDMQRNSNYLTDFTDL